jgi:NitT/TauT family transport system substrate-binding protein
MKPLPISRGRLLAAGAGALAAPALFGAPARAAETVTVGITNAITDVPFFIGTELGYFRQVGLDVALTPFDSAAKMVPSLGAGQLDVAAGAASASLYNAVARGIEIKIVADKGSTPRGLGYAGVLVRTDLIKSGKVKTARDLKGLKVAEGATGAATNSSLDILLRKNGLTYNDVQHVYLGFPEQVVAFQNGSIDASYAAEPSIAQAVRAGFAVRMIGADEIEPNEEFAVLLYGGPFIHQRREVGVRFMAAYLRAVRFYLGALRDGHLRGANANAVIDILIKNTPIKDRSLYLDAVMHGVDPNGRINLESLRIDLAFYKRAGFIEVPTVEVDPVCDGSLAAEAVRQIGRG